VPFGLPLVNENLKIRRGERGDLDMPHRRDDSVDEALSVAAQARGLEGAPGAVADLAPLGTRKPCLAGFSNRSASRCPKASPVK
jgi:hypothetical protein